jgi:hypothetical protein
MHLMEKGGKIFFEVLDSQKKQMIRRRDYGI